MKLEDFDTSQLQKDPIERHTFKKGDVIRDFEIVRYLGYKIGYSGTLVRKEHYWLCKCKCGNLFVSHERAITQNYTKSCGCHRISQRMRYDLGEFSSYDPLYKTYYKILRRCYKKDDPLYPHYGARGIEVEPIWRDRPDGFKNFANWMILQGYVPHKHISINRNDNNGNYGPDNCHLAGLGNKNGNHEQLNNKSNNRLIDWYGTTYTAAEIARRFGFDPNYVYYRLNHGKSIYEIVSAPIFKHRWDRQNRLVNGIYPYKPIAIKPIYFIDHPNVSTTDPKLNYYSVEELDKMYSEMRKEQ